MLMTAAAIGNPGYLSSEHIKPAAIVQPAAGSSPNGSDLMEAVVRAWTADLIQAENTLLDWFRDPDAIADDDSDPISKDAIRNALTVLQILKSSVSQLSENSRIFPLRGVSVGTGGSVSLEFSAGRLALTYVFKADGSAEQMIFDMNRLRLRLPISLG